MWNPKRSEPEAFLRPAEEELRPQADTRALLGAFLTHLGQGKPLAEALRRSGADWSLINQQLRADPTFALQCLATQDERAFTRALRLASLTDAAIDVVERAISSGDARVALELLKELAVLRSASTPSISNAMQAAARERRRLLLVEDEEPLRDALSTYFRNHGYEIVAAAGSAEDVLFGGILSDIYAQPPDLDCMMLDINLPGISGLQLARIVRDAWPQTATVFITGDSKAARTVSRELGTPFVLKPFRLDELEAVVSTTLHAPEA